MENRLTIYIHIFVALLTTIALYLGLKPLTDVTEPVLIIDAVLSGIILSALLILLKNIVQYSHFSSLHTRQRLINYSALAILFVVCWLGLGFFILYMSLPEEDWGILSKTVPVRIIIALLVYGLALMIFMRLYQVDSEDAEPDTEIVNEEESVISDDLQQDKPMEVLERIAVKSGQKIEVIPVSEIIYLQAEGDYVMIHSTIGKFLKEQTMKSLENTLPPDKFVRVHRSSIINVDFIARIELYDKQTQLLMLKNGAQVRASINGYKALRRTLGL